MEVERKVLVDVLQSAECQEEGRQYFKYIPKDPKSAMDSETARKTGNDLFLKYINHDAQTHKQIFNYYCKSIALAPIESQQLALAYANRSYFLLHIHKYEDSIKDIDQALKIITSDAIKANLLCRKAECLKRCGSPDFSSTLEAAQKLIDKLDDKDKTGLLEIVNTVKTLIVNHEEKVEEKSNNQEDLLQITDDYSSSVSIQYNEKYGRHLVAARDYQPGDIIFVEKIYASAFEEESTLSGCDYCSKPTWSNIPCNYCEWSMYCSESCKDKAWNDFHDIECTAVSYIKEMFPDCWVHSLLAIRVLITAIKEFGNIQNLKKKLESLDDCTDAFKGFLNNGQLSVSSITSLYSLSSIHTVHEQLVEHANFTAFLLIGLIKHSKLKNDFNVKEIEDLFINEDVIFLGSLFMKMVSVISLNAHFFQSDKEIQEFFHHKSFEIAHVDDRRCLSTLYSLLNHSCTPTADWRFTRTNKLFVYALQPIKKNEQIFICYQQCFNDEIQSKRQAFYLREYNFTCDCQACTEMWPSVHSDSPMVNKYQGFGECDTKKLQEVYKRLEKGKVVEEDIKTLSSLIIKGMDWKPPSLSFWMAIDYLRQVFVSIYSSKALLFNHCK